MIRWVKKWGWLALVAAGAVLGAVLLPRWNPWEKIAAETRAIDAEERARLIEADAGRAAAIRAVKDEYRSTLEKLEGKQKRDAEALSRDPARLARLLNRLSD